MTTGDYIDLFFIDYDDMDSEEKVMEDLHGLRSDLPIIRYEIYKSDSGYHLHVYLDEKVQFNRVFLACCSTRCCGNFLRLVSKRKAFGIRVSSSFEKSELKCIKVQNLKSELNIESHGGDDDGQANHSFREGYERRRNDCKSC